MSATNVRERVGAFHDRAIASPHHRYLSWEHCYRFFRFRTPDALLIDRDAAALQLGMYLACGSCGLHGLASSEQQPADTHNRLGRTTRSVGCLSVRLDRRAR
jgi:hypothetical protein